jgi:DUF971 family protein
MVTPQELRKIGDVEFRIKWSDGHESRYTSVYLRANCFCAACINELTGERMVRLEDVPKDLKIIKADLVGNYALSFHFSDGHGTGIYAFENLRRICPCCAAKTETGRRVA